MHTSLHGETWFIPRDRQAYGSSAMTTWRIALVALLHSLATHLCASKPSGVPGGSSGQISNDERVARLEAIGDVVEGLTQPVGDVNSAALFVRLKTNSK